MSGWDVDPADLWRVEDPAISDAVAVSATGAVVIGEPVGVPHRHESVPLPDGAFDVIEGRGALGVDAWHASGHRGQGVRIAVFDVEWYGADWSFADLGDVTTHDCWFAPSCDLPMDVDRARFSYEEGRHGVGCAQVIRAIAPDAELHLVRVNGQTTLENAVDWAIREQIDIVSLSMSFFNASFYDGRGPISQIADRLAANGVLLVTSAGNYARGQWSGTWRDGDGDGRLDFNGDNGLWVYQGGGRGPYVAWDQYQACGLTDLDASLYDEQGALVARGWDAQRRDADRCEPFERLTAVPGAGWYRLEVRDTRGPTADLRVQVLSTSGQVDGGQPEGSVTDPGASRSALTVGAVRADGYLTNGLEGFSSRGPTADGRSKPDLVGPDGLTVEAYGAEAFYGTSASAPAVAAAIAVVMSSEPGLSARDAADRLSGWTWGDVVAFQAPDPGFGAGRVRLPPPEAPAPCGRRPLILPLLLLPIGWRRRRRPAV